MRQQMCLTFRARPDFYSADWKPFFDLHFPTNVPALAQTDSVPGDQGGRQVVAVQNAQGGRQAAAAQAAAARSGQQVGAATVRDGQQAGQQIGGVRNDLRLNQQDGENQNGTSG